MGVKVETVYLPGLRLHLGERDGTAVAEALGVSKSSISLLINCHRGASLHMALSLARYCGVTVEDLVAGQQSTCHQSIRSAPRSAAGRS